MNKTLTNAGKIYVNPKEGGGRLYLHKSVLEAAGITATTPFKIKPGKDFIRLEIGGAL